jgi:uncharacterized protein
MAREFPDWIDPWKAAEGNRSFRGSIPFSAMERLAPLLAGSEGTVRFVVRFSLDGQRRAMVDVEAQADLPLVCQVSLEPYEHAVDRVSRLAVIEEEADQLRLPEGYEGTCTEAGRLNLVRLVEDECLLAMPQVPRKPGLEFEPYSTGGTERAEEKTRKPFADLGEMLKARRAEQDSGTE